MHRKLTRMKFAMLSLRGLRSRPWQSHLLHFRLLHSARNDRSRGFTLTEVVIASTLLIIAMVPILKALTTAFVTTSAIERKTHSLMLAQGKLDEIRARSIYHYSDSFTETNCSVDGSYLCNVDDSSVSADLREITISVGYDLNGDSGLASNEVEVTLATLVARRW